MVEIHEDHGRPRRHCARRVLAVEYVLEHGQGGRAVETARELVAGRLGLQCLAGTHCGRDVFDASGETDDNSGVVAQWPQPERAVADGCRPGPDAQLDVRVYPGLGGLQGLVQAGSILGQDVHEQIIHSAARPRSGQILEPRIGKQQTATEVSVE